MNLYLIFQTKNDNYDTFDSAIVAAKTKKEARMIHPSSFNMDGYDDWDGCDNEAYGSWTSAENVKAELIGVAKKGTTKGVVLASYNAG